MKPRWYLILFLAGALLEAQENAPQNEVAVIENFEGGASRLQGNALIVDAAAEIKAADLENFNNETKFAKLSVLEKGKTELIITQLAVKEPSIFSFRYRTELAARFGQTFKVYVDDIEKAAPDGVDMGWRTERIRLPAGGHTIRFEAVNARGTKIVNGYNAVYLDDIKLFPDKITAVVLYPRGEQHTFLNAAGSSKLQFKARALLPDGSPKTDAQEFVYTSSGGSIDADGFFTPNVEGSFTVTATLGNFSIISSRIVVHSAGFLKLPCKYPGTGKTYKGYLGGDRAANAGPMPGRESLTISSPRPADFDADAYFLLEGRVNRPKGKNYARVLVRKIPDAENNQSQTAKLETWYIVKDAFAQRIWLPFGAGAYQIEIIEFDSVFITTPAQGQGMFRGGSYSQEPLTFNVYNTREEDGVDGDGRWIYPSFNVQSDDFRITNLVNEVTFGMKEPLEKAKAIHDYLVSALVYDTASFSNSGRSRKMDAVSVIENGTAVCDGYAYLSAAMLRNAGIPCKFVVNKAIAHSWNNVFIGGSWKFYDATWDDPVPDKGPGIIKHTYFLLDSLTGKDNKHRGAGTAITGDVE